MPNDNEAEQRPLLSDSQRGPSTTRPLSTKYTSLSTISDEAIHRRDLPSRSVEDDVLPETSTLGRSLTWRSSYILVISRVIGSGIFATPGTILQSVGSPGLSLLLWVVGAAIAAASLAISLEYGCMLPRSGAQKVYLEFTYRHPRFLASALVAINAIFLGFTASNCVIFSQYTLFAAGYHDTDSDHLRKGIATGLLSVVTAIHVVTPRFGVRLQDFLGWIKIGIIVFMVLCGSYVVVFQPTTGREETNRSATVSWDQLWEGSNWNWGVLSTALFKVFYSYAGLDNISNVLNEVKDPVRTLRSVTLTSLFTACGMYFLVNIAYFLVVPLDQIRGSGELIAALFFERVFGQNVGGKILPLAVALSAAGNVMVVVFAMVRNILCFSFNVTVAKIHTFRVALSRKLPDKDFYHSRISCLQRNRLIRRLADWQSTTFRPCW